MKKSYEAPSLEVVKFQYRDQVVAASGNACTNVWKNAGEAECVQGNPELVETYQG